MQTITLLLLFATTAFVAISVDRRIAQTKAKQKAEASGQDTSTKPATAEPAPAANLMSTWLNRLTGKKVDDQGARFRVWTIHAFANQSALSQWLNSLPDPAIQALATHTAAFCTEMGVELDWLLEQQVQQSPLAKDLSTMISHYLQACYTGVLAQDGVRAFKSFHEFDQNPYGQANKAFVQTLFQTLLDQKLTPPVAATFNQSPEHERQIYMVQAIRRAAELEPTRFQGAVLKAVKTPSSATASVSKETFGGGNSLTSPTTDKKVQPASSHTNNNNVAAAATVGS